ncbi:hypothetical protein [Lentzea sp. NPDC051838]
MTIPKPTAGDRGTPRAGATHFQELEQNSIQVGRSAEATRAPADQEPAN